VTKRAPSSIIIDEGKPSWTATDESGREVNRDN
jgi:hypothetical protein